MDRPCLNPTCFEFEVRYSVADASNSKHIQIRRIEAPMKAVRFHEFGDADVLCYEDVEQPVPGAGEVRVRVAATSFNPVDGGIRGGYLQGPFPVTLPHTPGIDVAGTADALGDGVHSVAVGDAVAAFLSITADGAAAEYVITPANVLAPAPTGSPLADAAAFPMVGLTAWQARFDDAKLEAGQRALINGAGGAVGGYAAPPRPAALGVPPPPPAAG